MPSEGSLGRNSIFNNAALQHSLQIDDSDLHLLRGYRTVALKCGGGLVRPFARSGNKSVAVGRVILGAKAGDVVDHINGNPWDNRRENLRLCSQSDNRANSRVRKGHKTGFKGVSINGTRFQATFKGEYLGTFDSASEAAAAYDEAARQEFGEFAAVNFPINGEQSAHRAACNG